MAFSRKTTRYYSDEADLNGAFRVLCDRMAAFEQKREDGEETDEFEMVDYFMNYGAALTIEIILTTETVENQERFIKLFDARKGGRDT